MADMVTDVLCEDDSPVLSGLSVQTEDWEEDTAAPWGETSAAQISPRGDLFGRGVYPTGLCHVSFTCVC